MDQPRDPVPEDAVDHVLRARHRAARVLSPWPSHRGAGVVDDPHARHGGVDGGRVPEVTERDVHQRVAQRPSAGGRRQRARTRYPRATRCSTSRVPSWPRRPRHQRVGAGAGTVPPCAEQLGRVRRSGDRLHPAHHASSVLERRRQWRLLGQRDVELLHRTPEARVRPQAAGQPAQPVRRHRPQRRPAIVERSGGAVERMGQRGRAPDGGEHAAHVGAQRAARGVHREDRLQRANVPRQPHVADPALAADDHVPLVEAEIRVAAARGEDGLDALDLAEHRAQQVEPVHAEVAEGVAAVAVVRRQRAVLPRRVGRAAEVLGADRLADPTRGDGVEHVSHVGVGEQRVVHAHAA